MATQARRSPAPTPSDRVLHVVDGYHALAGAIILQAVHDAYFGSREAADWIRDQGSAWLELIAPEAIDPDPLRRKLLERAAPPPSRAARLKKPRPEPAGEAVESKAMA